MNNLTIRILKLIAEENGPLNEECLGVSKEEYKKASAEIKIGGYVEGIIEDGNWVDIFTHARLTPIGELFLKRFA